MAKLARWLAEQGIVGTLSPAGRGKGAGAATYSEKAEPPNPSLPGRGELADLVERAARLAKADLVTGMVGEFPELQGVIGGYLAEAQGEPKAIAEAIRDHYKPVGQGDDVPTAPITVAVSLADKLDSLATFFFEREKPTGSRDPYALRRAALAVCAQIQLSNVRLSLIAAFVEAIHEFAHQTDKMTDSLAAAREFHVWNAMNREPDDLSDEPGAFEGWNLAIFDLLEFFADRLKVQQREAGVRHDLIDAVFALGGEDDVVRLLARVKALQTFIETEEGADLLVAYKRAANILKKEKWGKPTPGPSLEGRGGLEPEEKALIAALDKAEPKASAAIEKEDFTAAMAALASLRGPIDAFFDHVTVNDPDKVKRARRLNLLMRFRDAVDRVADFSKIEG